MQATTGNNHEKHQKEATDIVLSHNKFKGKETLLKCKHVLYKQHMAAKPIKIVSRESGYK